MILINTVKHTFAIVKNIFKDFLIVEKTTESNNTTSNTKRIAKNTLMLYFRQILIMLVSLYTVRVVLNVLGAEDYGIYNVVAGVVVLFSFVNNAMATSTQRFINYSLGEKNLPKVTEVYSASLVIHGVIALLFLVLAETIGLWFVSYKLNIPAERHTAALWTYQFSVISTIFTIFRVPYNATIIAYERMSFFAILSIIEAVFKLLIVFLISFFDFDKLIFYSILLVVVSVLITLFFKIYCNTKIETAKFKRVNDKILVKELISFSGWNLFGATANVANQQGTNIVLNIFTNVTVNAAMGIANQVNAAVYSFVTNFQTAFNPQLVKSYAAEESEYFKNLIIQTAKCSYYLLFLIVLPVCMNANLILSLWLKNVPEYAVLFVQLILIWSLIESLNGPLYMAISATGRIKAYQISIGLINFMNLPSVIIAFYLKASPLCVLYIRIILNIFALFFRIIICKKLVDLRVFRFLSEVIFKCVCVSVISTLAIFLLKKIIDEQILFFFISCIVSGIVTTVLVLLWGFNKAERQSIKNIVFGRK